MHPNVVVAERWARQQHDVISVAQSWNAARLPRPWPQLLSRTGRWVRLVRGVYWTRPEGPAPALQMLTAARLFAGGGRAARGTVVGRSAARLWGLIVDRGLWLPELLLGASETRHQPAGLRYRWGVLPATDLAVRLGLPCTTPARTALDVATTSPFDEGLIVADATVRAGLATRAELAARVRDNPWASALRCADGRAESPLESLVRAELIGAGLPVPSLQHVVANAAGRFVARVDLAWPEQRLAVEADGASTHASPEALRHDLRRQNALVAAGWTPLRFTWADRGAIAPLVAAALCRAASSTA